MLRAYGLFALIFVSGAILGIPARAQGGHGPVFGLATPTVPKGAWNGDITLMSVARGGKRALMARQTLRYGLTADLQLSLSVPEMLARISSPPRTRIVTMMGGMGDLEALALWRFHKRYPGVGQRIDSTLLVSALVPVVAERSGVDVGSGGHAAVVTGYVSRSVYAWGGIGAQAYLARNGDRRTFLEGYVLGRDDRLHDRGVFRLRPRSSPPSPRYLTPHSDARYT